MENGQIRALGIAPYEGMKSIMMKLAQERDDIDLTVYIGDLQKGVEIVRKNFQINYDVIISRGGTAEMIEKITDVPVIEISLSVYDILRAIKLAENYSERYAIIGFSGITGSAHLLCDLLQYNIDIFTIHHEDEVTSTLKNLKNSGYSMVLCDMITNTTAKKLGLNAILITSGGEGISYAFDQAVKLCRSYAAVKDENNLLRQIIRGQSHQTVVFDEEMTPVFSTVDPGSNSPLMDLLKKEFPDSISTETHKSFVNIEGMLYSLTTRRLYSGKQRLAAFYIDPNQVPSVGSKYGIKYSSKHDAQDNIFNNLFSVSDFNTCPPDTIRQLNQSNFPVMMIGESGTSKEQTANTLYYQSPLNHNPMVTVDCCLLNDKSWGFLTNHYNSPLNDNNNTIYFKSINFLPKERRLHLLSIIVDMKLCRRNRMIFSCDCATGESMAGECIEFVNRLSCVTLHLSPLRERSDELPTLSSLYLNTLNANLAKQIIGFEPGAMKLLQEYSWPGNYTQFKRALNELAIVTNSPYISIVHTRLFLEQEKAAVPPVMNADLPDQPEYLDLNKTLGEITRDIIQTVLNETGGNQSTAAKRLGISRTTLWRYLK